MPAATFTISPIEYAAIYAAMGLTFLVLWGGLAWLIYRGRKPVLGPSADDEAVGKHGQP